MVNYYDELEIEDFVWDSQAKVFHYPCPCGDRFEISKNQLRDGEEIATCPSCSLIVRVVYDYLDWEDYTTSDEGSVSEDDQIQYSSASSSPLASASDQQKTETPCDALTGTDDQTQSVHPAPRPNRPPNMTDLEAVEKDFLGLRVKEGEGALLK